MIVLMGTHALAQTTLQLPNPAWNDSKNNNTKLTWHQAMDGTLYSYKEGTTEEAIHFDFLLAEGKAEELARFFKVYSVTTNRMYDHDSIPWTFRFLKKSLNFVTQHRSEFKQVSLDLLARRL